MLDDYHVIEAPVVHEAVSFRVEHLPPGLRLVVLTRSDPPWPNCAPTGISLCEAVTGQPDGQAMLDRIERAGRPGV